MSERFPIAQALMHGRVPVPPRWWPEGDRFVAMQNWPALLPDCAFFDVSTAADLYWCGRKDVYNLENDWGPLRPPYPHMWMEWEVPHRIMLDGKMVDIEGPEVRESSQVTLKGIRYGALISTLEDATELPVSKDWTATNGVVRRKDGGRLPFGEDVEELFPLGVIEVILQTDGQLYVNPLIDIICVDTHTGQYIPNTRRASGDEPSMRLAKVIDPDGYRQLKSSDNNTVWMALNLLNCRNVAAPERNNAIARTTREKRQRIPAKRYHTIVLPGMTKRYDSRGRRNSTADEAVMAQHRVRGHFKTYTAEAPLLGRHTGTFWWGWQMRGSKERGEVVSDYKMEV